MGVVRTLFVSHDGGLAGAQRVLLTTVCGLNPDVVKAHLVVPREGELQAAAAASGIEVTRRELRHWAPCVANSKGAGRLTLLGVVVSGLRGRVWSLVALIERLGIDLVYTNTSIVLEGAVAAWRAGVPHIWHVHEPILGNPELHPLLPQWMYSAAIGQLADKIIMPSHALLRSYPSLKCKTTVIHNGIQVPAEVNRPAARRRLCVRLGLREGAPIIGIVGAIQPRKDFGTFISAARRVHARIPKARFVVVGSGAASHVQRFERDVQSAGLGEALMRIPHWEDDITEFFAGVDVAAISSVQESFGLTAAEALAVGTPVISTRCGGPEEVLGSVGREVLVDVGDVEGLATALVRLCEDAAARERLGRAGRQRVLENFSQHSYVREISDVICAVAGSRQHRPGEMLASGQ